MHPALSGKFISPASQVAIVLALCLPLAQPSRAQSNDSGSQSSMQAQQAQSSASDKSAQDKSKSDKPSEEKKDLKSSDTTTKLRIHVTAADKPVGNASVYVRFPVAGGLLHKDKLAEMNLKTNEDGSVKVPDIPRGKILIQVVAKGWKTYGKWYDIDTDAMTVEIKLEPPARWY
jgi:hypothetical protein